MVKFSTISLLLCDFWIFRAAQSEVSRLEVRLFRGYTTGHLIGPVGEFAFQLRIDNIV